MWFVVYMYCTCVGKNKGTFTCKNAFAIYEKFQGTSFIDKHLYLLCTKIKTFIGRLYVQIFFYYFPSRE